MMTTTTKLGFVECVLEIAVSVWQSVLVRYVLVCIEIYALGMAWHGMSHGRCKRIL